MKTKLQAISGLFILTLIPLSGCATYDAIRSKDPEQRESRVESITQAAQADLDSLAPIVSAVHPLGGVGVELASGALALVAALFGASQRRNAQRTTQALKTVAGAIEKAGEIDPEVIARLKSTVMRKSAVNGTGQVIDKAVQAISG